MNGKEFHNHLTEIYCGLLFTGLQFEEGERITLSYSFDCPEFAVLRAEYALERRAGKGSEFARALRLARWLFTALSHDGNFSLSGEELPMDSLSLLGFALKKGGGVNCACKAKILAECCLALGIYARTVSLYPASPYDLDNHVVTEIFDHGMQKWCMIDPTSGGYFSDGVPLSCLEMREKLANRRQCSVVLPRQSAKDLSALMERNAEWNSYYAKNCYYFTVGTHSRFGSGGRDVYLVPRGFDVRAREVKNREYLLQWAQEQHMGKESIKRIEELIGIARARKPLIASDAIWEAPQGE